MFIFFFVLNNLEQVENLPEINFNFPDIVIDYQFENEKIEEKNNNHLDLNFADNEKIKVEENLKINFLSSDEVIHLTNKERTAIELRPLKKNDKLTLAAKKKAEDIIEKNYFAHISPAGVGASDLVLELNYSFIFVGENLAKGIFNSENDLVNGWMNSPSHKENILKENYYEIGVYIKEGYLFGEKVFVAVQIFGTPDNICPEINNYLFDYIDEKSKEIENFRINLEKIGEEIKELKKNSISFYNKKIEEYNQHVEDYNKKRDALEQLINLYNNQVENRNSCLEKLK